MSAVILYHFRFCASRAGSPLLGLGAGGGKCTKPKVVQYSALCANSTWLIFSTTSKAIPLLPGPAVPVSNTSAKAPLHGCGRSPLP